jgi:pseudouridine synthase
LSITLKEGKKRQIRKMIEAAGNRVVSLKRVRIRNIRLGELPSGKYFPLNESEIRSLSSF